MGGWVGGQQMFNQSTQKFNESVRKQVWIVQLSFQQSNDRFHSNICSNPNSCNSKHQICSPLYVPSLSTIGPENSV